MARAVWGLILLALVAFFVPSQQAHAVTYSEAMATCQATLAAWNTGTAATHDKQCVVINQSGTYAVQQQDHYTQTGGSSGTIYGQAWPFAGLPPTDQEKCLGMPQKTGVLMAATNVCVSGCNYSPSDDGGRLFTVKGVDGSMRAAGGGTYAPTGAICNGGPSVPAPVTDPLPPRKLCGGGSCHDVAAGQFCAVNGAGVQVCIPDKPPAGTPGGCVTSGDTTLCAGNPPPLPPSPPIVDPASQITASDHYTDTGGAGSTVNNSTVNNYNQSGSTPNSGAGADDNKPPASSSSAPTPGDGTKAGGGGDCNSPPICEGAAATCMVVTQTWLLRCPPGGQGAGADDADTTVPGLDGVGETPGPGFMREESLLDKLDQGGFGGGGQCPKLLQMDLDAYGVHFDSSSLPWCDILGKAGYLLLLLAAFLSYRILSEK